MTHTSTHQDTFHHTADTAITPTIQDTKITHTADTTTILCIQDTIPTTQDTSTTQLLPELRLWKWRDQLTILLPEL
jgi:hypothetical protein